MKGLARRAPGGTPKILKEASAHSPTLHLTNAKTHMCKQLLDELPVLVRVECLVKAQDSPTPLETISSHLELVHRMHILDVHLDTRPIGSLGSPHIQIFVPTSFKVDGIIAIVEVREFWEEVEVVLRIQFGV